MRCSNAHLGAHYGQEYGEFAAEVLTGLGKLNWNRRHFRGEHAGIAALAEVLFEEAPGCYKPDHSALLLRHLREGLAEEDMVGKGGSALEACCTISAACDGAWRDSIWSAIELRLQDGLDDLPHAAAVEPPPPSSARDLIAKLQDDPELGAVARLAQLLLAAVQLPRACQRSAMSCRSAASATSSTAARSIGCCSANWPMTT